MRSLLLIVCIICTVNPVFPQDYHNEANHIIQENSNGWCTLLSYCPQVFNFLQTLKPRVAGRYAQELQIACGNKSIGAEQLICCSKPTLQVTEILQDTKTNNMQGVAAPTCGQVATLKPAFEFPPNNLIMPHKLPTLEEGCGRTFIQSPRYTTRDMVNSKKGAWPWIALIFRVVGNYTGFYRSGTLVTARHVITASINSQLLSEVFVRLGTNRNTVNAVDVHVDIPVEAATVNEGGYLAILLLERNVEFSSSIIPICMPTSPELRRKSYANHFAIALGFGTFAFDCKNQNETEILQEQQISFLDCKENYNFNDIFDSSHLCPRETACSRDYGSPLMIAEPYAADESRYFLIGIFTPIGSKKIYNMYRSTQYLMDWIEQTISRN